MYSLVKLLALGTSYDGDPMDEVPDARSSLPFPGGGLLDVQPAASVTAAITANVTANTTNTAVMTPATDPRAVMQAMIGEHSAAMFRVAKSIVRDSALAEDVVQDSLLKAWQAASRFRGDSSMRSWILRITQNTAISMLRKRREDFRDPVHMPELPDPVGQPDRQAAGRAMVHDLWIALGDLDQTSRTIVVLRELEGLTYEEISDVLDLPLPTIKTRLFRSRRALAAVLKEWR